MTSSDYRHLGTRPSLAYFVPLLQISTNNTTARIGRRVLLSGGPNQYKSCAPPFVQSSEALHASQYKFTAGGREP
jgi:hypothetical protein